MVPFYTNVQMLGDEILFRGVDEAGERFSKKYSFEPTLFVLSNEESEFKTLDGKNVKRLDFGSITEAKEFLKKMDEVENAEVFGNSQFQYAFISKHFPESDYDASKISIAYIDIEVAKVEAFGRPETVLEEIISIAIKIGNRITLFGMKPFISGDESVTYLRSIDEQSMLRSFIDFWENNYPDIVTGWNSNGFDIPYIVNRVTKILGEKEAKRLSPWRRFVTRTATMGGRPYETFEFLGIASLDYMELYKKFQSPYEESFKLDHIAQKVLGEGKLAYDGSLYELYLNDAQKFYEYNIQDVQLLDKMDKELLLIDRALSLAYDAKVNYNDSFSQVRMWDAICFNELKRRKIVMPPRKKGEKDSQYEGAYVKEPVPGRYSDVVSFDLDSLYPMSLNQFNISPETLLKDKKIKVDILKLINQEYDLSSLKRANVTMTANGCFYRKDKKGFLPDLIERMYEDRKVAKKKMLDCKKELERVHREMERRKIHVK